MNFQAWQYKRFHVSYMLGWLAVGIMSGLALSKIFIISLSIVIVLSLGLVVISSFRARRWWSVVLVSLCGLLIGWGRGSDFQFSLYPYSEYRGSTVIVEGVIKDDPQYGDRGNQQFRVNDVILNDESIPGEVYVGTFSILDVKRGDRIRLKGKLGDGFGSYQASLGFATLVSAMAANDPIREFRDTFAAGVRNAVEEPGASLGIGFVVGQRSALPEILDEQLKIVGLTHIVVASGYNLTILVRFARRMLEKHSKFLATAVSGAMVVGFVAVSGLSPSMTRASLVTGLSLLAWYYGRRIHPLLLIVYVASVTAYIYPVYLWSDIGWYLSFLAFAGVLIVAPLFTKILFHDRKPRAVVQIAIETTAAQLMTLPLILAIFGNLPVLSLISNILIAPLIPLTMLLTVIAGIGGMISYTIAGYIGSFAEMILEYIIAVVIWLASPTWSQIEMSISLSAMNIAYMFILAAIVLSCIKLRYSFRSSSIVD